MHILYVSQYFPPEVAAGAVRVYELAKLWVQAGHRVTVLTGFPNHPTGVVPAEYRPKMRRLVCQEWMDGIDVRRSWLLTRPNSDRSLDRIANYTSFFVSSAIVGAFLPRPDVVIGTSPQLLVGLSGWWLARLKRVPFVFEVRDLWPESLVAAGVGSNRSRGYRLLSHISSFLYRHSDRIVPVTPAFRTRLMQDWGVPDKKISVIQNGVDTDLFSPGDGSTFKEANGLNDKFVVSYVGTLGLAHGLGTILDAARRMKATHPHAHFLLIGEGAEKQKLLAQARQEGLTNVEFVPMQTRSVIPDFIRASDVALVLLRKADTFETVIPTKMLEFMACARPIVLGVDGQARELMEVAGAGIFVAPEDSDAVVEAILWLERDIHLRQTLGINGRQYVVEQLSRKSTAEEYATLLGRVVEGTRPPVLRHR